MFQPMSEQGWMRPDIPGQGSAEISNEPVDRTLGAAPSEPPVSRPKGHDWGVVAWLSVSQLVSWGCLYYSFSLFVVPMEADLGWSRTTLNGALSVGLAVMGVLAYPVGAWIDRRGGRMVMTAGSLLGGAMLVWWSLVESPWAFYGVWIGLGAAMSATLYEPAFAVLTRRFPDSYRKRITVLTLAGGFASTVFIPVTQLLIETFDWRTAALVLGLIVWALPLPVHAVLRDRVHGPSPSSDTSATKATVSGGDGSTLRSLESQTAFRRAVRGRSFWGLALCFTCYYAAFSALTFHIIPLLIERGVSMAMVVSAIALVGPAQVAGRVAILAVGRRLTAVGMGTVSLLIIPAAMIVLMALPAAPSGLASPLLFVFAALYGTANGIMTIVRGTIVPDLMGRAGYGRINGALSIPAAASKAAAPSAAAALWLLSGGYEAVLWVCLTTFIVAAAGFWFAVSASNRRYGSNVD
jgi:MFS family permease